MAAALDRQRLVRLIEVRPDGGRDTPTPVSAADLAERLHAADPHHAPPPLF